VSEIPAEVNEADLAEQRLEVDGDPADGDVDLAPARGPALLEADEADLLEQQLSVPVQDDDYRDA
jgi:hypothetical protein